MKRVKVQEAIGMVLCHDMTEIIPGEKKGVAFKKGHIIAQEDISKLLGIGKEHIYIWEINEANCHEDEAAIRIGKAICGKGIYLTDPSEGKVDLKAAEKGLLKINVEGLIAINSIEEIVIATLHTNQVVEKNTKLAGCRVVPLVIGKDKIELVENMAKAHAPLVEILPLERKKIGIISTGSEVFKGRIKDKFGPVVREKIETLGSIVLRQILVPDDAEMISKAIHTLIDEGAEMIIATGGMSVDPDDVTPAGIRAVGGKIITYGAPVLPGAMFMLADLNGVPILGLPGCVMYHRTTIFDLVFPRLLAGEVVTKQDIVRLAHGGLCSVCEECHYPSCAFGKSY